MQNDERIIIFAGEARKITQSLTIEEGQLRACREHYDLAHPIQDLIRARIAEIQDLKRVLNPKGSAGGFTIPQGIRPNQPPAAMGDAVTNIPGECEDCG